MLQLTKDEKEILKAFKNHEWFRILEKIENEARLIFAENLEVADLDNPAHLKILRDNQIYSKARKDFYSNIDRYTQEIQESRIKWID